MMTCAGRPPPDSKDCGDEEEARSMTVGTRPKQCAPLTSGTESVRTWRCRQETDRAQDLCSRGPGRTPGEYIELTPAQEQDPVLLEHQPSRIGAGGPRPRSPIWSNNCSRPSSPTGAYARS